MRAPISQAIFGGCLLSALVCGCRGGASAPISVTHIPHTEFVVSLRGPDPKGHYSYSVAEHDSILIARFLGPAQVSMTENPKVVDQGAGRLRIVWGSGEGAAFTVIDTKKRKIIGDSNLANPGNESF